MSEKIYPYGYGSEMIDEETLRARLSKAHPEFARRLLALIIEGNGIIGIGNLWRSSATQAANYARDPKTFAPAGASFHETQTFASGIRGCQAVDIIGGDTDGDGTREGFEHAAARKFLADNAARFGLVEFSKVNGEPWHAQSAGIPNSVRSWKSAGSPDPDPSFVLPYATGGFVPAPAPPPPPPPPPPTPTPAPAPVEVPNGKLVTVTVSLPILKLKTGPVSSVKMLQAILNVKGGQGLTVDGDFGAATDVAVKNWQTFFGLTADGIVGPITWKTLVEV